MAERNELLPLNEMDMPENSMEVRVWMLSSVTYPTGYRLLRQNGEWKAFSGVSYEVTPVSGWTNLWSKLDALDFLTLSGSPSVMPYGGTSVIEINDGGNYRIYHYNSPEKQKTPEAEKMIAISKLLREELRAADPKTQSAANMTKLGKETESPLALSVAESLASPQERVFEMRYDPAGKDPPEFKLYTPKKTRLDPDLPEVAEYVRIATDYVVNKRNINMPDDVIPNNGNTGYKHDCDAVVVFARKIDERSTSNAVGTNTGLLLWSPYRH